MQQRICAESAIDYQPSSNQPNSWWPWNDAEDQLDKLSIVRACVCYTVLVTVYVWIACWQVKIGKV